MFIVHFVNCFWFVFEGLWSFSLLNISCTFLLRDSILFPRSWIIFTLGCSSRVLSCSFFCNIFLCHLILSNFLCLWSLFLRLQDCNSSWFCCLPPGGWGCSRSLCRLPGGRDWLAPSHWWVEPGLVPWVHRVVSSGVLIGSCWLRTTSGSLSADGWVCVPTLLVVWPEAPQHWSLQAVGWVPISVPKWQPLGALMLMSIPWGLHHWCPCCPCPHCEPLLTPTSTGDPPRPADRSGPGSCAVTALPWVPVHVKPCVRFARVDPVWLLHSSPPGLQRHMLRGLFLLMPDPQAGEPDVGLTLTSVGEPLWYSYFPLCGLPVWWVWDLIILWKRPSYHLLVAPLCLDIAYLVW